MALCPLFPIAAVRGGKYSALLGFSYTPHSISLWKMFIPRQLKITNMALSGRRTWVIRRYALY